MNRVLGYLDMMGACIEAKRIGVLLFILWCGVKTRAWTKKRAKELFEIDAEAIDHHIKGFARQKGQDLLDLMQKNIPSFFE